MENLVQADIFFFISSIAAVVLGILLVIVLVYLSKILADIKEITTLIKTEGANIAEGVRDEVIKGSSVTASLFRVFKTFFRRRKYRN